MRVTVSTNIGGAAAGNMRFDHPNECFIVEVMTKKGTISMRTFHLRTCTAETCTLEEPYCSCDPAWTGANTTCRACHKGDECPCVAMKKAGKHSPISRCSICGDEGRIV